MTKEECIKNSYENIGEVIVSDNKNGWKLLELVPKDKYRLFDIKGQIARPKSLSGIENNNGWIKIESEADLPKAKVLCYVTGESKLIEIAEYMTHLKNFVYERSGNKVLFVTHYQPIIKPLIPLY